jgi:hypothetical protein
VTGRLVDLTLIPQNAVLSHLATLPRRFLHFRQWGSIWLRTLGFLAGFGAESRERLTFDGWWVLVCVIWGLSLVHFYH